MSIRALAIDSDPSTAGVCALCAGLDPEFSYSAVASVADAGKRLEGRRFNTIILGLPQPVGGALSLIERLRSSQAHRHLILAAVGDDPKAEIAALKAGVDVFVPKPVDAQILLARLQSVHRRLDRAWLDTRTLRCEGLTFDPLSRAVSIEGRAVKLGPKQLGLLEFFLRQPQVLLSKEVIWDRVWGYNAKDWRHGVAGGVSNLRRLLGNWMDHIESRKGFGFILNAPVIALPRSAEPPTETGA